MLTISTKTDAVNNSTVMYRNDIFPLQKRHFPLNSMKLTAGILSYQEIVCSQCGQWEGGLTTDSDLGIRYMQTFRKLPIIKPEIKVKNIII